MDNGTVIFNWFLGVFLWLFIFSMLIFFVSLLLRVGFIIIGLMYGKATGKDPCYYFNLSDRVDILGEKSALWRVIEPFCKKFWF
jgi:hypothetical protein